MEIVPTLAIEFEHISCCALLRDSNGSTAKNDFWTEFADCPVRDGDSESVRPRPLYQVFWVRPCVEHKFARGIGRHG
jgi:hypothetical protein